MENNNDYVETGSQFDKDVFGETATTENNNGGKRSHRILIQKPTQQNINNLSNKPSEFVKPSPRHVPPPPHPTTTMDNRTSHHHHKKKKKRYDDDEDNDSDDSSLIKELKKYHKLGGGDKDGSVGSGDSSDEENRAKRRNEKREMKRYRKEEKQYQQKINNRKNIEEESLMGESASQVADRKEIEQQATFNQNKDFNVGGDEQKWRGREEHDKEENNFYVGYAQENEMMERKRRRKEEKRRRKEEKRRKRKNKRKRQEKYYEFNSDDSEEGEEEGYGRYEDDDRSAGYDDDYGSYVSSDVGSNYRHHKKKKRRHGGHDSRYERPFFSDKYDPDFEERIDIVQEKVEWLQKMQECKEVYGAMPIRQFSPKDKYQDIRWETLRLLEQRKKKKAVDATNKLTMTCVKYVEMFHTFLPILNRLKLKGWYETVQVSQKDFKEALSDLYDDVGHLFEFSPLFTCVGIIVGQGALLHLTHTLVEHNTKKAVPPQQQQAPPPPTSFSASFNNPQQQQQQQQMEKSASSNLFEKFFKNNNNGQPLFPIQSNQEIEQERKIAHEKRIQREQEEILKRKEDFIRRQEEIREKEKQLRQQRIMTNNIDKNDEIDIDDVSDIIENAQRGRTPVLINGNVEYVEPDEEIINHTTTRTRNDDDQSISSSSKIRLDEGLLNALNTIDKNKKQQENREEPIVPITSDTERKEMDVDYQELLDINQSESVAPQQTTTSSSSSQLKKKKKKRNDDQNSNATVEI